MEVRGIEQQPSLCLFFDKFTSTAIASLLSHLIPVTYYTQAYDKNKKRTLKNFLF